MQDNASYQREMAESLVQSCGWRDALEFARECEWDGVLRHILALDPKEPNEHRLQ